MQSETFLAPGGRIFRIPWEKAYQLCDYFRIKTSLALTRARIRRAMEVGR